MRRVGGSHRGLDMWLLQRASAIYMALFLPVFLFCVLTAGPLDFTSWHSLFEPLVERWRACCLSPPCWYARLDRPARNLHRLPALHRCTLLRLALYFAFAVLYLACLVWTVDILWSVR
jgi:succinate dehydrogenase / fumarate reductase membrane anchor subunit